MAKVFLSLEISVKSASSKDNINKLNSNNIPFEEYEGEIYLINKNVFDSGVDLGSREYDKPYAKFCMRLADTTDSSIYMGEGSLDEEVLAVLYEVFGDALEFQLTLSCNSDWESISACIIFNEEEDKYYCDTEVTESSEEDDEEDEDDDELDGEDEKKIKYQLSELDVQLHENSDKIIEIKIAPGSGISEEIRAGDDEVTLDCIMGWNTGSFRYKIPANTLIKLLKSKPFDDINSEDLNEFDFELIKVEDGNLDFKKVNDIDIENKNEIIESLKGSKYEIDVEEEEDKYFEIEQQMRALYDNGDIYDSEYTFGSLFSLEFDDDEFGSYFVDWHYSKNLFTNAKRHYDDSDYEKAIEVLQKYIAFEDKKEGLIDGLQLIAESYEELEDYTNAVHFYDEVIKLDPTNDFYFSRKGYCLKQDQKYSEAEEAFRKAVDLNPKNIRAYMNFGNVLNDQEKYTEAIEVYNEGIKKNPSQPKNTISLFWLHQNKGHIYFDLNRWEEAIESYLTALEYDRNSGYTYYNLGISYYNIDNYNNSYNNFEIVHEKDPDSKDSYSYYLKGECKRMLDENEQAIVEYDLSIKQNNEEHTLHCNKMKGVCYLELKDFSNAVDSFNKGLKDKWSYQNLGKAYFGLSNYEAAMVNFNKVIEIDANYKWGYQEKGKTLFLLKKYQEAEDCFSKVIEIDPNYKWAYHEKGKVFLKLNDHASALKTFEKVIEIDPKYKMVFYDLAFSYQFMGMYEKAIDYYKKLISGNSAISWKENQNLLLHYNIIAAKNNTPPSLKSEEDLLKDTSDKFLLEALLERGKREHYDDEGAFYPEISLIDLNKVIEIDPKSYKAYFFRAKFYLNSDYSKFYSIEKGTEDLKSCLEIKRYTPALIRYAGLISDFDKKLMLITEAIELNPEDAFAWQKCGEILYNNEDYEGALEKFMKSNELESDGWSLQKIAKTYAALKLNDEAIDFYNKAIELVDWYENWMCELSQVYVETKQIDKAESSILKALNHYSIEKYYRQLYKILCLKYPSDDYKSVLSDISDFLDSCYFGWDNDSEKPSDLEYLKTYEEKLIFENKSIFSFFKFLKGETINHFIENGGYVAKLHLLKNQALKISLDHINKIISNSDYTVLETAISHQLVSSEMLDEIIDANDNSYLYSYKLLGVCSNPNVTEKQIEKLKSNKYNWVKQKAYSVTKEFNGIDKSDRYVLLGLLNNPNLKSTDHDYQKLLESTSPYNFTYKLDGGGLGIEEYSVADIPEEDVYEGFLEVAPQDENWSDYIANDWYNYGDSECGVTDYVGWVDVWSDDESNIAIPSFVSQVQSWPKNEDEISASVGEFVQRVSSGEKGEWDYHEFEMENEFRPENLHPKYTDSERAIEGYEYQGEDDWFDIEGELSESRGSYTDIELLLGTESGLVNIYFEDIKNEMEDQDLNPEDEADVKSYFQKLMKKEGIQKVDGKYKIHISESNFTLWEVEFVLTNSYDREKFSLEDARKDFYDKIGLNALEDSDDDMLDDIVLTTEIQYFACDSGHGGNIVNDCINALKEDSPGYGEMEFEYRWNKLEHKNYINEPDMKNYIEWALKLSSYGEIIFEDGYLIGDDLSLIWDKFEEID